MTDPQAPAISAERIEETARTALIKIADELWTQDAQCETVEGGRLTYCGRCEAEGGSYASYPNWSDVPHDGCLYGTAIEALAQRAQAPDSGREWLPMHDAPRDRVPILAKVRPKLSWEKNRPDLQGWDGIQIVVRSSGGQLEFEWNMAAPVGHGGFPDEWFVGWKALDLPPSAEQQRSLKTMADEIDPFGGKYVIWSREHGAWWRADSAGYCSEFLGAGLYGKAEAEAICADAGPRNEACHLAFDKYRSLVGATSPGTVLGAIAALRERSVLTAPTPGGSESQAVLSQADSSKHAPNTSAFPTTPGVREAMEECAKICDQDAVYWRTADPKKEAWTVEQMTARLVEAEWLAAKIRARLSSLPAAQAGESAPSTLPNRLRALAEHIREPLAHADLTDAATCDEAADALLGREEK